MVRICPNPIPWNAAYECLTHYAQSRPCIPPSPPMPLILTGWVFSNDVEKMQRWKETVEWAKRNDCDYLVSDIPSREFYSTEAPTSHAVGPEGGPIYREWDFEETSHPSPERIAHSMETLLTRWPQIVGHELARMTRPLAFTGAKARRLLVFSDAGATPPWGGWAYLSNNTAERRTFTQFRAAINKAIAPHAVDHIDFSTD
jgi:hypothetical protein